MKKDPFPILDKVSHTQFSWPPKHNRVRNPIAMFDTFGEKLIDLSLGEAGYQVSQGMLKIKALGRCSTLVLLG